MTTKQAIVSKKGAASKAVSVAAKSKTPKPSKKAVTREQRYRTVFQAPESFLGPDEFMPQVNGYGTPIYATVATSAGV